ncbi:hypothetical protein AB0H42_26625 [Nocardia sp. NPDC050799]|uniref:hypothetical protein n=1 Tax=Nocardia sp. NPDC050799 TaxID=3154842 RepID=UPI00340C53A2
MILPDTVLAHGVGNSQDLPLPFDLVLQAGAATIVLSFLVVSVFWRAPRQFRERPLPARADSALRSSWWRLPLRLAVLAGAAYIVGNALFGPRDDTNPAAHALFVWLWVGIVPVSVLFGPVWRVLNPLRTIHSGLCRILRLPVAGIRPAASRAGHRPAALALFAFVWLELVPADRTDPRVIGTWLSVYAAVQLGFALVRGEQWFARGDAFEMYSELAGRLSVLGTGAAGRLVLRSPLAGLAAVPAAPGTMAFVAVWWGSTIFDSASGSPSWAGIVQTTGVPWLVSTGGLVGVCVLVAATLHWTARRTDLALPLVPIAVGYTLAHYASLLITEGPRGLLLFIQQWGIAESAEFTVVPDPTAIAIVQVVPILIGHLLGVLTTHDHMLRTEPGRPLLLVVADEMPSVLLMIGYTWAGLFLLFAA